MVASLPLDLLGLVAPVGVGVVLLDGQASEDLNALNGCVAGGVVDLGIACLRELAGEAEGVDEAFLGWAPGEEQGCSCEVDVLVVDDHRHSQGHGGLPEKLDPASPEGRRGVTTPR